MRRRQEPIWLRKDTTDDDLMDQLIEQFCNIGVTEVQVMAVSHAKRDMLTNAL